MLECFKKQILNKNNKEDILEEITIDISSEENNESIDKNDNSRLLQMLSKADGYAIIIIIILEENGIEKALDIISRFPILGFTGMIGKAIFQKALERLSEVVRDSGESFIMTNIVNIWQVQGKNYEYILQKINAIPKILIDNITREKAIDILEKYYLNIDKISNFSDSKLILSDTNIPVVIEKKCLSCGHVMDAEARFCSQCGARVPDEYTCPHCGHLIMIA